ncbi:MAG: hypothetical protein OXU78_08875, partial [Deltaproteobacteria bacterium]|nr:hypothetical protein [Deltaproteobacteria bacterium]
MPGAPAAKKIEKNQKRRHKIPPKGAYGVERRFAPRGNGSRQGGREPRKERDMAIFNLRHRLAALSAWALALALA